ncbi:helix-turn-helix domain-containing protein [Cupriavidus pinatubonensis]|uniref:helix-turn-helix domain-containing protein n=1 Tax=Cupriavidus pinatubonensis TaxID=248026 RepID=UPI001CC716ED|nr:helix-turn-helix domain-containing protein [Cupriavidus pinatubonensis]
MNQVLFREDRADDSSLIYPTAASVRGRVLAALLRGEQLTQADALRRWATSRLGSSIYQLRKEFGWPIVTTEIEVETRDNGRVATVARYWLPNHAIRLAGARGQRFATSA